MSANSKVSSVCTFINYNFEEKAEKSRFLAVVEENGFRVLKVVDWSHLTVGEKWDLWKRDSCNIVVVANFVHQLLQNARVKPNTKMADRMGLQCATLSKKVRRYRSNSWCFSQNVFYKNNCKKTLTVEITYPALSVIHPERVILKRERLDILFSIFTTFQKVQKHLDRRLYELGHDYFSRVSTGCEYKLIAELAEQKVNVWEAARNGREEFSVKFEGINLHSLAKFHRQKGYISGYQEGYMNGRSKPGIS